MSVLTQCKDSTEWLISGRTSVHFGVDLFVEEALCQHIKFSVLLPDGMGAHKLELFERKLIKLVLHLPDVGLLQFGNGLFGGGLLLSGLS